MRAFSSFSKTSRIMLASIVVICVLMLIAGLFVIWFVYPFEKELPFIAGIAIGCFHSALKVVLLEKAISRSLDMDKNRAENFARLQIIPRYLLTAVVFAVVLIFPNVFGLFGAILGVLSLQLSAYTTNYFLKKL